MYQLERKKKKKQPGVTALIVFALARVSVSVGKYIKDFQWVLHSEC